MRVNHCPCANTQGLTCESEHSDGVYNHVAIHPQFQGIIVIVPTLDLCEICSQEQWWFRGATRRPGGLRQLSSSQKVATLPDLWSTSLVPDKLEVF